MSIWKKNTELERLNATSIDTLTAHLGILYTEISDNSITGTMPVDSRTIQPYGLLHGGASVVLAETLGSVAGNLCVADDKICVGLEINANHLRAVKSGIVTGTAKALHLGATTQIWSVEIKNAKNKLVCISRLTLAVINKPQ
jgi:1,4-dihydroxy-2-naphthoyl-CoA hydrolase